MRGVRPFFVFAIIAFLLSFGPGSAFAQTAEAEQAIAAIAAAKTPEELEAAIFTAQAAGASPEDISNAIEDKAQAAADEAAYWAALANDPNTSKDNAYIALEKANEARAIAEKTVERCNVIEGLTCYADTFEDSQAAIDSANSAETGVEGQDDQEQVGEFPEEYNPNPPPSTEQPPSEPTQPAPSHTDLINAIYNATTAEETETAVQAALAAGVPADQLEQVLVNKARNSLSNDEIVDYLHQTGCAQIAQPQGLNSCASEGQLLELAVVADELSPEAGAVLSAILYANPNLDPSDVADLAARAASNNTAPCTTTEECRVQTLADAAEVGLWMQDEAIGKLGGEGAEQAMEDFAEGYSLTNAQWAALGCPASGHPMCVWLAEQQEARNQNFAAAVANLTDEQKAELLAQCQQLPGGCPASIVAVLSPPASNPDPAPDPDPTPDDPSTYPPCDTRNFPGFINKAVRTIECHLTNAGEYGISTVYPPFRKAVVALMTLAVVVFGVAMMLGAAPIEKDGRGFGVSSVVLLLKIAAIIFLVMATTGQTGKTGETEDDYYLYHTSIAMKDGLLEIVNASVAGNKVAGCKRKDDSGNSVAYEPEDIWQRIDCVAVKVVGFSLDKDPEGNTKVAVDAKNAKMLGAMVALATALLFIPGIGIVLFMALIMFVLELVFAVARAVHIYLISHIAIILLVMAAPIFVPLILFQATREYFTAWLKNLTNYILQPVLLVAFLAMFAVALDMIIYGIPADGSNTPENPHSFFRQITPDGYLKNGVTYSKCPEDKPDCEDSECQSVTITAEEAPMEFVNYAKDRECIARGAFLKSMVKMTIDQEKWKERDLDRLSAWTVEKVTSGLSAIGIGEKKEVSVEAVQEAFIKKIDAAMPVDMFNPEACARMLDTTGNGHTMCLKAPPEPVTDPDPKNGAEVSAYNDYMAYLKEKEKYGQRGLALLLGILANLISMVLLAFVMASLLKHLPALTISMIGGQQAKLPMEDSIVKLVKSGAALMTKTVKG